MRTKKGILNTIHVLNKNGCETTGAHCLWTFVDARIQYSNTMYWVKMSPRCLNKPTEWTTCIHNSAFIEHLMDTASSLNRGICLAQTSDNLSSTWIPLVSHAFSAQLVLQIFPLHRCPSKHPQIHRRLILAIAPTSLRTMKYLPYLMISALLIVHFLNCNISHSTWRHRLQIQNWNSFQFFFFELSLYLSLYPKSGAKIPPNNIVNQHTWVIGQQLDLWSVVAAR